MLQKLVHLFTLPHFFCSLEHQIHFIGFRKLENKTKMGYVMKIHNTSKKETLFQFPSDFKIDVFNVDALVIIAKRKMIRCNV